MRFTFTLLLLPILLCGCDDGGRSIKKGEGLVVLEGGGLSFFPDPKEGDWWRYKATAVNSSPHVVGRIELTLRFSDVRKDRVIAEYSLLNTTEIPPNQSRNLTWSFLPRASDFQHIGFLSKELKGDLWDFSSEITDVLTTEEVKAEREKASAKTKD